MTHDTLIPRPETELLLEQVLRVFPNRNQPLKILDIGTGSGCLVLSALAEYPNAQGVGIDISRKALTVAKENAATFQLDGRVDWIEQDILTHDVIGSFDILLSNPPYIAESENVSESVAFEPQHALFAGETGLVFYERIAAIANRFVTDYVILEIGKDQGNDIQHIFKQYQLEGLYQDLQQHDRCCVFTVPDNEN